MMRRHLRGRTRSSSRAGAPPRRVLRCSLPRVDGVCISALRGSRYSYASRLKSGGAVGASSRRLCVSQRPGGPAHSCAPVDRRRRPRTQSRQRGQDGLTGPRSRLDQRPSRGWHLSAVWSSVCCTGSAPMVREVSYHLTRPTTRETSTMDLGTGCLAKCPQIQTRTRKAAAEDACGPLWSGWLWSAVGCGAPARRAGG